MDFDRGEMTLSSPQNFTPPPGAHEVKLTREGTLHYLPISIAGLPPVLAAFDLGNGGAISLSQEYQAKQPVITALPYAISLTGGVGGLHESRRVTLPTVRIGGFSFEGVPADLSSQPGGPYAGKANVGIQMFRPFKLTIDLGHDGRECFRDQVAEMGHDGRAENHRDNDVHGRRHDPLRGELRKTEVDPERYRSCAEGERDEKLGDRHLNQGVYRTVMRKPTLPEGRGPSTTFGECPVSPSSAVFRALKGR